MAKQAVAQVPNEPDREGDVPFRRSVGDGQFVWAAARPIEGGSIYVELIEGDAGEFDSLPNVYALHAASGIRLPRYYALRGQAEKAARALVEALPHIDWSSATHLEGADKETAVAIILENGGHV